jgi:Winged helix DNA-binding domain
VTDVLTTRAPDVIRAVDGAVLGVRALNRALLHRQLLLHRQEISVADALEHLVGLQSQNPNGPYIALWSRLADFDPEELADLVAARKVARVALMRWTLRPRPRRHRPRRADATRARVRRARTALIR